MFKFNIYLKMIVAFVLVLILSTFGSFISLKSFGEVSSLTNLIEPLVYDIDVLSKQHSEMQDLNLILSEFHDTNEIYYLESLIIDLNKKDSALENMILELDTLHFEEDLKSQFLSYKTNLSILKSELENITILILDYLDSLNETIPRSKEDMQFFLSVDQQNNLMQQIALCEKLVLSLELEKRDYLSNIILTQKEMYNVLIKDILTINIAILIFGIIIALSISRYIESSLNKIKQFVYDISKGKFDSRINVDTNDEFEELAKLSDDMRKDLNNLNTTLEKKVLQRTNELKKANFEIVKMLKFKSNFLNQVAHDIRTPITAITLSLNLIKMPKKDTPSNIKNFKIIKNNLKSLTELVNDVLNISRIDSGKVVFNIEKHNLKKVINQIISNYSNVLKKEKISVEIKIPSKLSFVYIDDAKISEVIQNLISNSIKYLKGVNNPKIIISAKNKGSFVEVEFKDNGPGVPKEHIDKVFDEFYKVDQSGQDLNAGLGLSICNRIIDKHGGKISVSSYGKGFVLKFTLPTKKKHNLKTKLEKSISSVELKNSIDPSIVLKNVDSKMRLKIKKVVAKRTKQNSEKILKVKNKITYVNKKLRTKSKKSINNLNK